MLSYYSSNPRNLVQSPAIENLYNRRNNTQLEKRESRLGASIFYHHHELTLIVSSLLSTANTFWCGLRMDNPMHVSDRWKSIVHFCNSPTVPMKWGWRHTRRVTYKAWIFLRHMVICVCLYHRKNEIFIPDIAVSDSEVSPSSGFTNFGDDTISLKTQFKGKSDDAFVNVCAHDRTTESSSLADATC